MPVRSGMQLALSECTMSSEDYQRAMADLIRLPSLCRAVVSAEAETLDGYELRPFERERLYAVARHRGMVVNCMLYRASRLVGITRRLPVTVELLGPVFREVFDAYLLACPNAEAEFDREACCFARFITSQLEDAAEKLDVPAEHLLSVLTDEVSRLAA